MPLPDLTPELEQLRELICRRFELADGEHRQYRDQWDRNWRAFHAYTDFKRSVLGASTRDRDNVIRDGQREFGARLHIPYIFTVIETTAPRMISNRPRMLWLPRDPDSAANTDNMRWLCDAQQERTQYELRLQTTGKTGLILGLGVQKCAWRYEERRSWRVAPAIVGGGFQRVAADVVVWDDPWVEDVDPYDWFWDPFADSVGSCRYVVHRTWRDTPYVLEQFANGTWDLLPDARSITAEDLEGGGGQRYEEVWSARKMAQGYTSNSVAIEGEGLHEVWEYHTPAEVVTILDRHLPVRQIANPAWHGELPFQVFRPTEVPHRMVGKGEPEPLEGLQSEMDTLRSQRRDNATFKLQQPYFYEDGTLDPRDLRWGAGIMNPVNTGGQGLRDVLMPMNVGDIPNSGYMEEDRLRGDIERVSGISDQTAGAVMTADTATGAQLVEASANMRIQAKTRRLEAEMVAPTARHFVLLNQQRIVSNRTIRIPQIPQPGQSADQAWAWRQCTPAELAGMWDISVEGGSTAPENVPQNRQDASLWMNLSANPLVNSQMVMAKAIEMLGVRQPQSYLAPDQHVPPETLNLIFQAMTQHMNVPPDEARQIIQAALDQGRQQEAATVQGGGQQGAPTQQQ